MALRIQFVTWAMVTGLPDGRRIAGWPGPQYYLIPAGCPALAALAVFGSVAAARRTTTRTVTRFG